MFWVRRWGDWKTVLPLYDGRECPDCRAVVVGRDARRDHKTWHLERTEFDSRVLVALRKLVVAAGLNLVELDQDELPEGRYSYNDELTAKARTAMAGRGYDDEEDDEEEP